MSILSRSLRRHYDIRENEKISIPLGVVVPKIDAIAADFPPHYACLFQSGHAAKKGFSLAENRRVNTEIQKWLAGLKDGAIDYGATEYELFKLFLLWRVFTGNEKFTGQERYVFNT